MPVKTIILQFVHR